MQANNNQVITPSILLPYMSTAHCSEWKLKPSEWNGWVQPQMHVGLNYINIDLIVITKPTNNTVSLPLIQMIP